MESSPNSWEIKDTFPTGDSPQESCDSQADAPLWGRHMCLLDAVCFYISLLGGSYSF